RALPGHLTTALAAGARPRLAAAHALPVSVLVAAQPRPGLPLAPAFALAPARDDQRLPVAVLDLDPRAGPPPGLVLRVEPLAHDAFESCLGARVEHRLAAALLVRRGLPGRTGQLEVGQRLATVCVAIFHPRVAVLPQQVEQHVG